MIIDPQHALNEGWISYPPTVDLSKCKQPNGWDFQITSLFDPLEDQTFQIDADDNKMHAKWQHVPLTDGFWTLKEHQHYDFSTDVSLNLPNGVAGILLVRSTLNRNGLWITSGLYDAGYSGSIGGQLRTGSIKARIAPKTRIGQICLYQADGAGFYSGSYNKWERSSSQGII